MTDIQYLLVNVYWMQPFILSHSTDKTCDPYSLIITVFDLVLHCDIN
jgi:hypothetical protein